MRFLDSLINFSKFSFPFLVSLGLSSCSTDTANKKDGGTGFEKGGKSTITTGAFLAGFENSGVRCTTENNPNALNSGNSWSLKSVCRVTASQDGDIFDATAPATGLAIDWAAPTIEGVDKNTLTCAVNSPSTIQTCTRSTAITGDIKIEPSFTLSSSSKNKVFSRYIEADENRKTTTDLYLVLKNSSNQNTFLRIDENYDVEKTSIIVENSSSAAISVDKNKNSHIMLRSADSTDLDYYSNVSGSFVELNQEKNALEDDYDFLINAADPTKGWLFHSGTDSLFNIMTNNVMSQDFEIDTAVSGGKSNNIVAKITSAGQPVAAWIEEKTLNTSYRVAYRSFDGANWSAPLYFDKNASNASCSSISDLHLALDSNDAPHVIYKCEDTSTDLVYGYTAESEVKYSKVAGASDAGMLGSFSFTLDAENKPHILSHSATQLNHISFDGTAWSSPTSIISDSSSAKIYFAQLSLDNEGILRIIYMFGTDGANDRKIAKINYVTNNWIQSQLIHDLATSEDIISTVTLD